MRVSRYTHNYNIIIIIITRLAAAFQRTINIGFAAHTTRGARTHRYAAYTDCLLNKNKKMAIIIIITRVPETVLYYNMVVVVVTARVYNIMGVCAYK